MYNIKYYIINIKKNKRIKNFLRFLVMLLVNLEKIENKFIKEQNLFIIWLINRKFLIVFSFAFAKGRKNWKYISKKLKPIYYIEKQKISYDF